MLLMFRNYILIFGLTLLSLNSMGQVNNWFYQRLLNTVYNDGVPLLSINEFNKNIDNYHILDSRSSAEFEVSHIKGSNFLDFDHFKEYNFSEIDNDQPILVYCSIGARSQTVAEHLINNGFTNVYNLEGGIFEWINQSNEVVNKDGEKTNNIHTYSKAWGVWVNKGNKVQ